MEKPNMPKAEYKVLQGTAPVIEKELAKLNNITPWSPILMTSTPAVSGTVLYVIVEHMIGS
jgi:hypothetical protein